MNEDVSIFGPDRPLFGQIARELAGLRTDQLDACLAEQHQNGGRLGEILRARGALSRQQLGQVLEIQARHVVQALTPLGAANFFPVATSLSVCLPAYNEAANIEDTLDAACAILPQFVKRFEVVVTDDGSTDGTGDVVARFAASRPEVRLIRHVPNRGYGAAVSTALKAARGDLVMFTDSDGQFSFLDLASMLTRRDTCDVVLGYRYKRADHWARVVNAYCWNRLIRLLFGVRVRDLDCAFKVFRRETVQSLEMTATGAAVNAEILAQCVRRGLRMREVPVNHYPRIHGSATGARVQVIARAFRELPQLWRYHRRGRAPAIPARSTAALAANGHANGNGHAKIVQAAEPKLKVCVLAACPFPANHGTPGSIREMSEAVADRGHEVHVVTYHIGENIPVKGPVLHRIANLTGEDGVIVGPTRRRPLYDLQMIFKTLEVIRTHKPMVLHAHGYEAMLAAWCVRCVTGLPVVYSGHNTMADELASYNAIRPRFVAEGLARLLDSLVPRLADRCIPHSANIESFLLDRGLRNRMSPVLPFGINLDAVPQGNARAVRAHYRLGDGPVILYSGVMNEFQRLDLLLEAMVPVLHYEPRAKLFLVATIPDDRNQAEVLAQARKLGIGHHVVMTEPTPLEGVWELLSAADVTVVPRPQAPGFPIKLINYLAARKPCVLFASSASTGLIDGENVAFAAPDTSLALGEAILSVLRDETLRRRLARNGYRFVREHHDRRATGRVLCEIYYRTLAEAGRSLRHAERLPLAEAIKRLPAPVHRGETFAGPHRDPRTTEVLV